MALNKADLLDEPTKERRKREAGEMGLPAVTVSAFVRNRLGELAAEVLAVLGNGGRPGE